MCLVIHSVLPIVTVGNIYIGWVRPATQGTTLGKFDGLVKSS